MHSHIEDEDSMQIVWERKEPLDRCLNRAELLQNHHRPPLARAGFSATAWLLTVLPVSTFFEATIQDTLLAKMGSLWWVDKAQKAPAPHPPVITEDPQVIVAPILHSASLPATASSNPLKAPTTPQSQ